MTRSRLVLVPQALAQHLSHIRSVLSPLHISRLDALQDAQTVQNVAAITDNAIATILGHWPLGRRRTLLTCGRRWGLKRWGSWRGRGIIMFPGASTGVQRTFADYSYKCIVYQRGGPTMGK
jgi:hypothetical protein